MHQCRSASEAKPTIRLKVDLSMSMMLGVLFGTSGPTMRKDAMVRIRQVEAAVILDQQVEEDGHEYRPRQGMGSDRVQG